MMGSDKGWTSPLSVEQVCRRYGFTSPRAVRDYIRAKGIEVLRVGQRLRFDDHALNQLESAMRCRSDHEPSGGKSTSTTPTPPEPVSDLNSLQREIRARRLKRKKPSSATA